MKLMHLEVSVNGVSYYYQNEAYDFVSIDVLGSGATLKVENEGLEVESSETVHGMEATYRIKSGVSDVIWSDEEHIFIVSTTFSKEECFRIAEGLIN
jgi:glycine cleavage system H lipoate-binding protein